MEKPIQDQLEERYKIPKGLSPEDTYNCKEYWRFRKDMLDGKLIEACRNCSMQTVGYDLMCERLIDIENETLYL